MVTDIMPLTSGCDKTALGPETSAAPVKTTDSVLTIPLSLMAPSCQCALGIVEATQGHYTQNLWAAGINKCNGDVTPTIGSVNQLAASAAAADSLRRQIDNPGAPSANAPRVAGSGVWLLRAAVGSASSGPSVAPATIALPGIVS
jgi:hypothetical protein